MSLAGLAAMEDMHTATFFQLLPWCWCRCSFMGASSPGWYSEDLANLELYDSKSRKEWQSTRGTEVLLCLRSQSCQLAHHQLGSCEGRLLWKLPYSLLHPLRELSERQLTVNSIAYNKNKPSSAHSTRSLSLWSAFSTCSWYVWAVYKKQYFFAQPVTGMNYKPQWISKALPDHGVSDRHQITQPPRTLQKKQTHETSSTPDHSLALPLQ